MFSQLCVAAFPQEPKNEQYLAASPQSSPTGQTGAGTGSAGIAAAKPGQADGMGNLRLEGRRPLYRLNRSDVVELTFTLSPELDQVLTVQPDCYVFLKDAGSLLACGLTLEEFRSAVGAAYKGYLHDRRLRSHSKILSGLISWLAEKSAIPASMNCAPRPRSSKRYRSPEASLMRPSTRRWFCFGGSTTNWWRRTFLI